MPNALFTRFSYVQTVTKDRFVQHYQYLLPEELTIEDEVRTEERYRGIFTVPVYTARLRLRSTFWAACGAAWGAAVPSPDSTGNGIKLRNRS